MLRAFLIIASLGLLVAVGGYLWIQQALSPVETVDADATVLRFDVKPGATMRQVAYALEEDGLIRDARVARWFARAEDLSSKLKVGEYELSRAQSTPEILVTLAEGRVQMHSVVIPEGLRATEIATRLADAGLVDREAFLEIVLDPEAARARGLEAPSLEGYLFPDTYRFARGLPADRVVDAARPEAVAKVHGRGRRTARENLADLVDDDSFEEYGAFMYAAQTARRSRDDLIANTPGDGIVGGPFVECTRAGVAGVVPESGEKIEGSGGILIEPSLGSVAQGEVAKIVVVGKAGEPPGVLLGVGLGPVERGKVDGNTLVGIFSDVLKTDIWIDIDQNGEDGLEGLGFVCEHGRSGSQSGVRIVRGPGFEKDLAAVDSGRIPAGIVFKEIEEVSGIDLGPTLGDQAGFKGIGPGTNEHRVQLPRRGAFEGPQYRSSTRNGGEVRMGARICDGVVGETLRGRRLRNSRFGGSQGGRRIGDPALCQVSASQANEKGGGDNRNGDPLIHERFNSNSGV